MNTLLEFTKAGVCWKNASNGASDFEWPELETSKIIDLALGKYKLVSQSIYGSGLDIQFEGESDVIKSARVAQEYVLSDSTPSKSNSITTDCSAALDFVNQDLRTIKDFEVVSPDANTNFKDMISASVRWIKFIFEKTNGTVFSENFELIKLSQKPTSTKTTIFVNGELVMYETRVLRPSEKLYSVYSREVSWPNSGTSKIVVTKATYSYTPTAR